MKNANSSNDPGLVVNHKKIGRLMRDHDLQPKIKRRFVATTDSGHGWPIYPRKRPPQGWPKLATSIAPTNTDTLASFL